MSRLPEKSQVVQHGFTLIELMIAMVISLLLLAGLYSNFIMQSRVQNAQSEVVETTEDLRIAAQIMQSELRMAEEICWDAGNSRLIYKPLGSAVALGACNAVNVANGAFDFRPVDGTHPTPYVCWDQPNNATGCQELLRDLKAATGLQVAPTTNTAADLVGIRSITLTSTYTNHLRQSKDWGISFDAWPRNQ